MITVEIFTHTNVETEEIIFEQFDLSVIGLTAGDNVIQSDFDKLYEAIKDIDTTNMPKQTWIKVCFNREFEPKEYEAKNMYFDFVEYYY